ncbi:MAG: hypothetical protein AAF899_10465 [Pseudomonadota bacterium]
MAAPALAPFGALVALQAQAACTCVAIAANTVQAMAAASARNPLTVNQQFNAPFSRDFSQDIDPVTSWVMPFAFGLFPGTPRAAALVTEVRSLLALAERLVDACDEASRTLDADLGAGAGPAQPMSTGELAALRRCVQTLGGLIGSPHR